MCAFSTGFVFLSLYVLSFILPHYVEYYINNNNITNIWELIFTGFSVMLLAPVTEEFLFRGIILQKWAIKWGVKAGILTSSFLFAVIHFRFDIINLSLMGIILSILYLKTRNLLAPIFCHFFYNTFWMIFTTINYFSKSEIERIAFISLQEYQNSVQPLLGQLVFLIAISAPFLIYFVYKNFPKNDAIIPYYANEAKTNEIN
ncbi:MAG: CPBP family intramembrane metalloprotease [Dolichospermum sp. LBC05a]|nr:CPBP family intramembrane metalloprotease [Dolichospermum sp. OL01]MCO5797488.1 CPBP family intramembrane metalloprotease [Dolichospermum sp. OL03]MCS6282570.1 CPBP family intramembrane metalloprotease [Dolichospermum sp.]QSV59009.1 MAG: CPBP family intramembrane metalloprotease [Dolichospermum sp. LBC05a]